MTNDKFLRMADQFRGTAFVCFEVGESLLAIGRREDSGPICLYERDRRAEPEGHRRTLATFEGQDEAVAAGVFIARIGEMIW